MSWSLRAAVRSAFRRDSVRLAGMLAAGGLLAVLFRDGSGATAFSAGSPDRRKPMAEISAPDLNGRPWSLSAQRGSVVLVNFWASWCPPCQAETPALVRLADRYRESGVRVVGVSMDDSPAPVRGFVARFGVPYPVVMGNSLGALTDGIESLPTSLLIDRQGLVAKTYFGAVREPDLVKDIDALLAER